MCVFPILNLRSYGQVLIDPASSLMPRSDLLGFSQPFRVRREGCRLLSPLYELPRIMRSKQRFFYCQRTMTLRSSYPLNLTCRAPLVKCPILRGLSVFFGDIWSISGRGWSVKCLFRHTISSDIQFQTLISSPNGNRTRLVALKGQRPSR